MELGGLYLRDRRGSITTPGVDRTPGPNSQLDDE